VSGLTGDHRVLCAPLAPPEVAAEAAGENQREFVRMLGVRAMILLLLTARCVIGHDR
jgi:hypothetical protein